MDNERALTDLAKKAIKEWDIDVESINLYLQSENTVFKVEGTDGNAYALRIHRKGYHDLDELNSEHAWTSCLSSAGLSVPEAVVTKDGDAYAAVFFPDSEEYRYVGLVKWIEGTILNDLILELKEREVIDLYISLGKVVARFHKATMAWEVPEEFKRHSFDTDGFVGSEPFWGRFWEARNASDSEREKLTSIRNNIAETLSKIPKDISSFGMIHADMHSQNVLIHEDKLSVIDFDDAGFGWYGFDLAVAVWDRLDFTATGCHFDIAYNSLVKGYLEESPKAINIIESIPAFLLMRTLMLIRWIEDRPEAGYEAFIPVLINASLDQAKKLNLLN
jgi:Ser/Thr protein kinase RdoA (MazF antagonist)